LGDFVIGWLFVFAGIFLLLLYSSLQMGVIDSPCAFITHLEVSVFFFSLNVPRQNQSEFALTGDDFAQDHLNCSQ
jgi:hypothetical protein